MSSCFDVAKYILQKLGPISAVKLQKLVYYAQAWSLVWDEKPLFNERIEAWVNGPVVPELFNTHRGLLLVDEANINGDVGNLADNQKDTVDRVLKFYGHKNPQWLSDLTHLEDPWKNARRGLPDNVRGSQEITLADMMQYYSSIPPEEFKN